MQKRFVVLGALACALSIVSDRAEAAYTYAPAFTLTSPTATIGGTSTTATATQGGVTFTLSFPVVATKDVPSFNSLNLGNVNVIATTTTPVSFDVNFTDTVTITNISAPGGATPVGTLTFTGTISLSGVSTTSGTVLATVLSVTGPGTTNAGGNTFVMSNPTFASPTIGAAIGAPGTGNISATITATSPVPAPASIVMLGLGMGAMGLVRARRFFAA